MHHHLHGHETHCQMNEENQFRSSQDFHLRRSHVQFANKDNYENTTETEVHHHQCNENSESTDTSSCADRVSHTLPVRKMKKRMDGSSIKSNLQSANCRTNVQNVFAQKNQTNFSEEEQKEEEEHSYHEPDLSQP